jgi:hypothetical protein
MHTVKLQMQTCIQESIDWKAPTKKWDKRRRKEIYVMEI